MPLDGTLVRDLLIQAPVIGLLVLFIFLERREHRRTVEAMREEIGKLQQALIDHMNRLGE